MLWLLMTSLAHADCEQQAESTTVWPSDQTVGTDVLIDLTQRVNPSRVVELRNVGTDELTPTERFVSRSCIDWDYDCGTRFRPSVPLAPDSEWDVLMDGIPPTCSTCTCARVCMCVPACESLGRAARSMIVS